MDFVSSAADAAAVNPVVHYANSFLNHIHSCHYFGRWILFDLLAKKEIRCSLVFLKSVTRDETVGINSFPQRVYSFPDGLLWYGVRYTCKTIFSRSCTGDGVGTTLYTVHCGSNQQVAKCQV